jgi:capsular polysaccharide export protein
MREAITFSRGIHRLSGLTSLLGIDRVRWRLCPSATPASPGVLVLGWGRKRSFHRAQAYATRHGLSCITLEDGFLRSIGLGREEPPLSIVVDDLGIYYDASCPSRLEALVSIAHSDEQLQRAHDLMALWREGRVSKYNHAREAKGLPAKPYVLVVDQTHGDASIRYGQADASSFQRMLDAALAENPDCTVQLKVHPDVVAGRKHGHFDLRAVTRVPRVQVLAEEVHSVSLVEQAQAIYTVTSQVGFEALLWGKRVRTFGMPFYAGWGLTQDELPAPGRRKSVALEDLVYAALVDYPRYLDPETGRRCEPERLLEWLSLQRSMRERFPARVSALGFSLWKRPIVRGFLQGSEVRFVWRASQLPQHGTAVVWGRGALGEASHSAQRRSARERGGEVIRIEDGFLRSVGLGADLVRPLSWVMDRRGMYYDATRPSDLEHLLQTREFEPVLLQRAAALRQRIVAAGLSKYNLGGATWQRTSGKKSIILVPGQVETDASIALGASGIRRNIDLLRAVRDACPDAWIVYKPHPDVVAGLRRRGLGESGAARWCDEVVTRYAITDLLEQVDEVHVMTSLAGFEALLRGKKVTVYGRPFYAGWGLTDDRVPVLRRTRKLSLEELVAGVLIVYPTYVSRVTRRFTTPERALDELLAWRGISRGRSGLWRGLFRLGLRIVRMASGKAHM